MSVKRGMRIKLDVDSLDGLKEVFEDLLKMLEQTDDMYPIDWSTLQIQSAEEGFRVSVMTEEPPEAVGVLPVEPTIQIHATGALLPPGQTARKTAAPDTRGSGQVPYPAAPPIEGFPDTLGFIQ